MAGPRVLILSASIGEGHDLPARVLADAIRRERPDAYVRVEDGLQAMGGPFPRLAESGSQFDSQLGDLLFDVEYWLLVHSSPTRRLAGRALEAGGGRGLLSMIATERADVVVSTYPGVTEPLGRLRARGRLGVPVVSAITDLAALRFWAQPGVDLHLVTHPEAIEEVRAIAPRSRIVCTSGLTSPDFLVPRDGTEARRDLGLPSEGPVVVISGGGYDAVRARLAREFARDSRVRVEGFTDRMGDWLAAGDVLVHSTAGLTVLEAIIRGCAVISYGWGRGHIRANNRAYTRFGLAEVAATREALAAALRRALANRPAPDLSFARLPSAASEVLRLTGR